MCLWIFEKKIKESRFYSNLHLYDMEKPKLCWVTADYFTDCDLKPELLKRVSEVYSIHWIVVFFHGGNRYHESDFDTVRRMGGDIQVEFFHIKHRHRDLRFWGDYRNLRKKILSYSPDLVYLNISVGEVHTVPLVYHMPSEKTIITAHQGRVHEGMKRKQLCKLFRWLVYRRLRNVNMFSESQMQFFKETFPQSRVFLNHLGLKEFGNPTIERDMKAEKVRFLSFGIINYAKNIDLLIDAAESLYDEGEHGFVVSINGGCSNWQFYDDRIHHPELFENDIRLIPNEDIPNLFTQSHFFVQPYRVVSQSGPLKIAYRYHTPVIVSDLPGFTDEVTEGVSGFIFEHENIESLKLVLRKAIKCYRTDYDRLIYSMTEYVHENYSEEKLAETYLQMFNTVIKDEK